MRDFCFLRPALRKKAYWRKQGQHSGQPDDLWRFVQMNTSLLSNAEGRIQNVEVVLGFTSAFLLLHSYFLLLTFDKNFDRLTNRSPATVPAWCAPGT